MIKELIKNIKNKKQKETPNVHNRKLLFWGTYKDYAMEDTRFHWEHYDCFEAVVNQWTNDITEFRRLTSNAENSLPCECVILDDKIIQDKNVHFAKSYTIKYGDIVYTLSPIPMLSLSTDIVNSNLLSTEQIESLTNQQNAKSKDSAKLRTLEKER